MSLSPKPRGVSKDSGSRNEKDAGILGSILGRGLGLGNLTLQVQTT